MRKLPAFLNCTLFAALLCLPLAIAQAEEPVFSEAELDQMMAPIALYPDSLLAQILMAATYPTDVAEASKWSKANSDLQGDDAVKAVQEKSWDPSVMSLAAFPQVLAIMGEKPEWVKDVGDAFLAAPETVMDTVQKLRKKAKDQGNLETTEEVKVKVDEPSSSETIIVVEPADPQVVYVPNYNPTIVYGTWWWPGYTPWYYYPPGYGFGSAVIRGIGFGIGIGITNALWGNFRWGWGRGSVDINVNRYNNINIDRNRIDGGRKRADWKHNPEHRGGAPYRDRKSREQFANKRGGADQRKNYRGRDAQRDSARSALEKRGASPAEGRKQLQGAGGDKVRNSLDNANRDGARSKLGERNAGKARGSGRSDRAAGKHSRNNAFSGAGNGRQSRKNIQRGQASNRSKRVFDLVMRNRTSKSLFRTRSATAYYRPGRPAYMSFRHFLVGKRLHNITANDSTPRTDALFVSPLALSHVGSTVSPRGYQGLPAFASLSMAGSE